MQDELTDKASTIVNLERELQSDIDFTDVEFSDKAKAKALKEMAPVLALMNVDMDMAEQDFAGTVEAVTQAINDAVDDLALPEVFMVQPPVDDSSLNRFAAKLFGIKGPHLRALKKFLSSPMPNVEAKPTEISVEVEEVDPLEEAVKSRFKK